MKKNLFLVFTALLTITLSVFAADWVQIYEKIYLDASSLSSYNYYANYNNDKLYSIWGKMLNDGKQNWKVLENYSGKKAWYNKTQWIVNCSKNEIAVKSTVWYDLKEDIIGNYDSNYLDWKSVTPETVGEGIYHTVCRATAPKIKIRSR